MKESSCCLTYLLAFGVVSVLDFGHSNRCVMISHYFNLHFPYEIRRGTSFHVLICHLYIFGETSVKVFGPFLIQVVFLLSSKSALYILGNSPLYQVYLLQIFFPSLWLLSVFCKAGVFTFKELQHINYFFYGSCLWYYI